MLVIIEHSLLVFPKSTDVLPRYLYEQPDSMHHKIRRTFMRVSILVSASRFFYLVAYLPVPVPGYLGTVYGTVPEVDLIRRRLSEYPQF
eukprot:SAG11_NODE_6805_length_1244_cov_5.743231_1_plen_89_part_00